MTDGGMNDEREDQDYLRKRERCQILSAVELCKIAGVSRVQLSRREIPSAKRG